MIPHMDKAKQNFRVIEKAFGEMVRFVFVGGIAFAVDLGTLVVLQEMIFKNVRGGLFISTAIAFVVSLAIHYVLTVSWVFKENKINTPQRHFIACTLFIITNVIGLGLNEFLLWIGVLLLGFHYVVVKVFAAGVVMIWNYIWQRNFIFTRGVHHE